MSDLYYLNARLRAMRARLLSRSDYEKLLASPGISEIAAALRETAYRPFVESVGAATSDAARLEEALRRSFQETLTGLLSVSAGDCREAVRLLLGYWEVQAVKTVLRGTAAGRPAEEILGALVPTGLHGEPALQELCMQPNVRAVVGLLMTWRDPWGVALSQAMREYREPKDLFVLETALDRFRAAQAAARLRGIRRPHRRDDGEDALSLFIALSVDRANVTTALKVVEEGIPPAESSRYFLPGGRTYDAGDFDRILSSNSPSAALGLAAKGSFARALGAVAVPSAGIPLLAGVERQLDRALLGAMRSLSRRDPLGWAPLAVYLLDKTCEIRNVRMIFRGRQAGLSDTELPELLTLEE